MRITRIEPQKRKRGRKNLYVDGVFAAGVSDDTLLRLGLRTGDEIDPARLEVLRKAEHEDKAKQSALHFLSYRARTVREVEHNLRKKGFAESEIEATIWSLESAGLLNDAEFARLYIRSRMLSRPSGNRVLKQKLLALGVSARTADEAIDEELMHTPPEKAALKAGEKFLRTHGRTSQDREGSRRRLCAFLERRGFPWQVINSVVQQLLQQDTAEEDAS